MKCMNCGHEMPDDARFCEMCGTPVESEQTMLADDDGYRDDPRRRYTEDIYRNNPRDHYADDGYRDDPHGRYADDPRDREPLDDHIREHAHTRTRYGDDFSDYHRMEDYDDNYNSDRRYDDYDDNYSGNRGYDDHDNGSRRYSDGESRYNRPSRAERRRIREEQQRKKKKKALIISIVALVLVIAILGGVIFFVNRNTVSAAELQDAKDKYLPPAQAISIDTSLDDPSNDQIQFKYDDRARIISCSYSVNDKAYDQRYTYDDAQRRVNIETSYRKHPIFTKDIDYDRVKNPNTFETPDDYYVRLDEKCFEIVSNSSSSSHSQATDAPKPTDPPATDPPTEEPTEEPTEAPTGWKELYIDYLNSMSDSYNKGSLIYINDDEIPELVLYSGNGFPSFLLWIRNEEVQSTQLGGKWFTYCERGNHYSIMQSAIYITASVVNYEFDGINEPSSTYNCIEYYDPERKENVYEVNGEEVSKEDFSSSSDGYEYRDLDTFIEKSALPDYIRNFE